MMQHQRDNMVVKRMGHASMGAWAVERVTIGATDE
jgi:hypothetical protein